MLPSSMTRKLPLSWTTVLVCGLAFFSRTDALPASQLVLSHGQSAQWSNDTFQVQAYVVDQPAATLQDRTLYVNVGEKSRIQFMFTVERNGEIKCREPLDQISALIADPPGMFYSASEYTVERGNIVPNPYPKRNPFEFVPWYGGDSTVTMTGKACQWIPDTPTTITATVEVKIRSSSVKTSQLECPAAPQINYDDNVFKLELRDEDGFPNGCTLGFQVTNSLSRIASYAIVQFLLSESTWVVVNGRQIFFNTVGGLPALDARTNSTNGQYVLSDTLVNDVAPGDEKSLEVSDPPGIAIGNGCYTRPADRSKILLFDSIGFLFEFETFVLQDYNVSNPIISQTPIGGSNTVVSWGGSAQATRSNNGWVVDEDRTRVQDPKAVSRSKAYNPFWVDYVQNPERNTAKFNEETKCWDLAFDP